MTPVSSSAHENDLLASLPIEDYRRISQHLRRATLKGRQTLQKRDEPLRDIYFPDRSLCSLVMTTANGLAAELAVVGAEGLIGVESVLGLPRAMSDATVQIAGDGACHVMSIDAFHHELDRRGPFHTNVTRYVQAFVGFLTQSVACNGLHSADVRCCRWLLHAHDRVGGNELPLTHDLLASMLAVRRPTVTLVIAELVRAGIISGSRGAIRITDRVALEARACECYRAVKDTFNRLLSVASPQASLREEGSLQERSSGLAVTLSGDQSGGIER
jgi:CRP-like cAMP-binding protein